MTIPILVSCGQENDNVPDDCIVWLEEFDLPVGFKRTVSNEFVFDRYGTLYAVSSMYLKDADKPHWEYVFLKSEDRARTWSIIERRPGYGREICEYGNNVFCTIYHYNWDDALKLDSAEVLCWSSKYPHKVKQVLQSEQRIHKFHVFNDSTFVCASSSEDPGPDKDTLLITRNSGKIWTGLDVPGAFHGAPYITYSGNNIYVGLIDEIGAKLYVKDLITESDMEVRIRGLYNIAAADSLFTSCSNLAFWKHDADSLIYLSSFKWNRGYGSYCPNHLFKNGDMAICIANQFPGVDDEEYCILGSVDGGRSWQSLLICGGLGPSAAMIGESSRICPDSDSLAILFIRDKKFNILTLRKPIAHPAQ